MALLLVVKMGVTRMARHLILLFFVSFLHTVWCSQRVAIVGGGVGGAFSAYFLANATTSSIAIDVFEAKAVGGRAQDMEFGGELMEVGASMIYGKNYYMKAATKAVGLSEKTYDDGGPLHIFDGRKVVFTLGNSAVQQYWAILSRYGLAPLVYGNYAKYMFHKLAPIYSLQDEGVAFDRVDDMLKRLGLYSMTQARCNETLKAVLQASWWGRWSGGRAFSEEFVAAINRCNYNQGNGQLNALAGGVSYLPAADPDVWAVKEGHSTLAARLLEASHAKLHLHTNVSAILDAGDNGGKFLLQVEGEEEGGTGSLGPYDAVIIAAPLEKARLLLPQDIAPLPPPRKFQTTISTFVRGEIQSAYFYPSHPRAQACEWGAQSAGGVSGLLSRAVAWLRRCLDVLGGGGQKRGMPLDAQILVTEGADAPFSAVTMKKRLGPNDAIYKVFSTTELTNATLVALFGANCQLLEVKHWKAYPQFQPPETFAPFKLAPGLFYGNAIENAASAMEMSAIAARNSALLAAMHLAAAKGSVGGGGSSHLKSAVEVDGEEAGGGAAAAA